MRMSKRLTGDLGEALYFQSCRSDIHLPSLHSTINRLARVLDENGEDFRLFLRAAGADDDEQARGRMRL